MQVPSNPYYVATRPTGVFRDRSLRSPKVGTAYPNIPLELMQSHKKWIRIHFLFVRTDCPAGFEISCSKDTEGRRTRYAFCKSVPYSKGILRPRPIALRTANKLVTSFEATGGTDYFLGVNWRHFRLVFSLHEPFNCVRLGAFPMPKALSFCPYTLVPHKSSPALHKRQLHLFV